MRRKYQQILSREVPEQLQQGAAIVDIRRPEEWHLTGIVAGSHLLTFYDAQGDSQPEEWLRDLDQLVPQEQPLLLICRTGHRTGLICEHLIETTSRVSIYNVSDGILGWLAEGFPVDQYMSVTR
ncbi:MAG: rhodanese-like domain-containing protein [Deltaproteobacteria bacterium]|jgi:rhodanese-related sulfurtransferase|nr:rhodanese-like domain-containing protein [Deltaproteobacteria bacterium]MCW8893654.1 rhodanese-like domain-containing protein [Deltaproteobacteria bacterium]